MGLRLRNSSGNYVELNAPSSIATDVNLTLPNTDGDSGQYLQTNGSGALSWATITPGKILQVQSTTAQGLLSSTSQGAPSVITNGVQVFSLSFTPLQATSNILVQTSSIAVHETTNNNDRMWVALWDGTTFVGANSGTWSSANFLSGLNGNYASINELYAAGSTTARTIQVRAGSDSSGTVYVNGGSTYNYTGTSAQIRMTVMEVAA